MICCVNPTYWSADEWNKVYKDFEYQAAISSCQRTFFSVSAIHRLNVNYIACICRLVGFRLFWSSHLISVLHLYYLLNGGHLILCVNDLYV